MIFQVFLWWGRSALRWGFNRWGWLCIWAIQRMENIVEDGRMKPSIDGWKRKKQSSVNTQSIIFTQILTVRKANKKHIRCVLRMLHQAPWRIDQSIYFLCAALPPPPTPLRCHQFTCVRRMSNRFSLNPPTKMLVYQPQQQQQQQRRRAAISAK